MATQSCGLAGRKCRPVFGLPLLRLRQDIRHMKQTELWIERNEAPQVRRPFASTGVADRPQDPRSLVPPGVPTVLVMQPQNLSIRKSIDDAALSVVQHGQHFEQMLMERPGLAQQWPQLQFLFQNGSPENMYYRWRVFSLLQGDTMDQWNASPFVMFTGGPTWIPPPSPTAAQRRKRSRSRSRSRSVSRSRSRSRSRDRHGRSRSPKRRKMTSSAEKEKNQLPRLARAHFEDLLRRLVSTSRRSIRQVMGFALEHTENAIELVQCISESLNIASTPLQSKLARLFVVSDILHNCNNVTTIPNLHVFRSGFEATLPIVFESFGEKLRSITGRMSHMALREQLLRVLKVWDSWMIYPEAYLEHLRTVLLRNPDAPTPANTPEVPSATPKSLLSAAEIEGIVADPDLDGSTIDLQPLGLACPIDEVEAAIAERIRPDRARSKWDDDDDVGKSDLLKGFAPPTAQQQHSYLHFSNRHYSDAPSGSIFTATQTKELNEAVAQYKDELETLPKGLSEAEIEAKVADYHQWKTEKLLMASEVRDLSSSSQAAISSSDSSRRRSRSRSPDRRSRRSRRSRSNSRSRSRSRGRK